MYPYTMQMHRTNLAHLFPSGANETKMALTNLSLILDVLPYIICQVGHKYFGQALKIMGNE